MIFGVLSVSTVRGSVARYLIPFDDGTTAFPVGSLSAVAEEPLFNLLRLLAELNATPPAEVSLAGP
jgi:hypothetical protein